MKRSSFVNCVSKNVLYDWCQEEDEHGIFNEFDVFSVVARTRVMAVTVSPEVVKALEEVATWPQFHKTFLRPYFTDFRNRLECSSMASLYNLV